MINLTTISQFRDYIKIELGYPVICPEISDDQYDHSICKSIDAFTRYNYTEGNFEDFMILPVSAGVSAYDMPDDINDAIEFILDNDSGINTLFTNTHSLLYNDWVVGGNYPSSNSGSTGLQLSQYDSSMMNLKDIQMHFGTSYRSTINPSTGQLNLVPTPKNAGTALVNVYRKTSSIKLYNNFLVRELAVSYAKKIWGNSLKKTTIQLPGGGTVNGSEIYSDAVTEIQQHMEDIKGESATGDFWIA